MSLKFKKMTLQMFGGVVLIFCVWQSVQSIATLINVNKHTRDTVAHRAYTAFGTCSSAGDVCEKPPQHSKPSCFTHASIFSIKPFIVILAEDGLRSELQRDHPEPSRVGEYLMLLNAYKVITATGQYAKRKPIACKQEATTKSLKKPRMIFI